MVPLMHLSGISQLSLIHLLRLHHPGADLSLSISRAHARGDYTLALANIVNTLMWYF